MVWRAHSEDGSQAEVHFRRAALPDLSGENILVGSASTSAGMYRPYLVRATPWMVFAIWEQSNDLRVARSEDVGATFAPPVAVPVNGSAPVSDAVYMSPGRLVIAYQGQLPGGSSSTILAIVSEDNGESFSDPIHIAAGLTDGTLHYPSMAYSPPNNLYVAWHRKGPDGWMTSTVDGLAWTAPSALPIASTNVLLRAGKGSTLYVAGLDNKALTGGALAFLVTPDAGGEFWNPGFAPSKPGYIILPTYDVVADRKNGRLHAAWWEMEVGPKDACTEELPCGPGFKCVSEQCIPDGCTSTCSRLRLATVDS